MSNLALPQTTVRGPDGRTDRIPLLHVAVWLLFAAFVLRFAALWANGLMGTSLPVLGRIGFTLLFAAFSVAHATSRLGWQRALLFLLACATVSWSFEEVGVTTGLVYGAYHYGTALGPKLAAVPAIIPLAWFMMTYASWVVANLFLEGASDLDSARLTTARIAVAAMVMTAWDTVMDPGMARSGVWTWDQGGAYFGVPTHNFAGWLGTMLTIYLIAEIGFRRLGARPSDTAPRLYAGLPVLAYAILALDRVLLPDMPELRINAAFGMGLVALIAVLRLTLVGRVPS